MAVGFDIVCGAWRIYIPVFYVVQLMPYGFLLLLIGAVLVYVYIVESVGIIADEALYFGSQPIS